MCDYCTWIESIRARVRAKAETTGQKLGSLFNKDPVVMVHGGAGGIPPFERRYVLVDVKNAAVKAYGCLIRGRHCLDAVEMAIRHLEGERYSNCARGGSLDANGEVVMDAAIMDGDSFKAGCVGAVRDIEHPISLARMVLHRTDQVLIVESGAQRFAVTMGIPAVPRGWLIPEAEVESSSSIVLEGDDSYQKIGQSNSTCYDRNDENDDTVDRTLRSSIFEECNRNERIDRRPNKRLPRCVSLIDDERRRRGRNTMKRAALLPREVTERSEPTTILQIGAAGAVAYDRNGRLASGTSTAGNPGKMIGSMSPSVTVIGCGIFADRGGCASVSGAEEAIYAYAPARRIVERLNGAQDDVRSALKEELDKFEEDTSESHVGAIALNADGKPAISFKSIHFPWAYCESGHVHYGCQRDEIHSEKIEEFDRPLDCTCEDVV